MVVDCIEFCILSSLNFTLTYALIICFPMGRPLGHPQGTQGEWYNFGIFFFLRGIWKRLRPRGHIHEIYSSFVQWYIALDQSFFAPIYFILMPHFDIMIMGVHTSPWGRAILSLIIHMKKLLDSDWLRAVQFKCNTSANYTS